MASQLTRSTCADCQTDWTGTGVLTCPMCGGHNISGEVLQVVMIPTIPIPAGLEDWAKKVLKHVPKTP